MPTQTKRTPPIVVDPNVERLMTGDMLYTLNHRVGVGVEWL